MSERTAVRGRRWVPACVLALMACYFFAPDAQLDFSAFDARDAESYLALSRSLVAGLGYTRNLDPQYYIPHTTWPPGVPLLLAPTVALAGMPINLLVVKLGTIACGAAGILLAYLYALRRSGSPLVQLAAPLLLGLNPYYWQLSRMTLSEVPTLVWALLSLLLVEIGWEKRTIRPLAAAGIGLVAGFGMLIRGSLYGALFLPLAHLVLRRRRIERRHVAAYAAYAAGFVVPFLVWQVRDHAIDTAGLGQDGIDQLAMILRTLPMDPASPLRSASQILSDMRETVGEAIYWLPKALVPGFWAAPAWEGLGPAAAPVATLLSLAILFVSCAARENLPIILIYGSMAALNFFYAAGGMARLWVPVAGLIAVSLPFGFERLRLGRLAGTAGAAALAASLVFYIVTHEERPYRDDTYAALANLFETVRAHGPLDGSVLTPDPQAFALVTGASAPMPRTAIGVDPAYAYIVLPYDEWTPALGGNLVARNGVWALVALDQRMKIADIRARIGCTHRPIPAFAVIANCPIW